MDKHRPIHHRNMTAGRRIIVIGRHFRNYQKAIWLEITIQRVYSECYWVYSRLLHRLTKDDNTFDKRKVPKESEFELAEGTFAGEEELEGEESDSEGEDIKEGLEKIRKMMNKPPQEILNKAPAENEETNGADLSKAETEGNELETHNDTEIEIENGQQEENKENVVAEEDEDVKIGKRRVKRKLKAKAQKEKEKSRAERKIRKYYDESYIGKCTSGVVYLLSQQLNKEDNKVHYTTIQKWAKHYSYLTALTRSNKDTIHTPNIRP